MKTIEVLAKNEEEALAKVAAQLELTPADLEVIEEYEPDELDLKTYAEENGLAELPSAEEITLYRVQISFAYYLKEAQEWANGLIQRFAPGASAEAVRFRNIIIVRLDVPEASILIGKQGATLDALQHVVVRALLTLDEDFPDVMLDVERYREKKLIRLEKEARHAADRAIRTGRSVPLTPMTPPERKFVHNLLKEIDGVRSESRGEDRRRHIVVESLNPARGGFKDDRRDGSNRGRKTGGNKGRGGRQDQRIGATSPGGPISEEQRQLLYGRAMAEKDEEEFDDVALEEKRSLLPEFKEAVKPNDDQDDDDGQSQFMDEIDRSLR